MQTAHSIKPTCNICHVGIHHQAALNRHKQEQHNRPTSNVSENRPAGIQNRPAVSKGYCIFFLQQRGCKKGYSCDFLHEGGQPRYTKVLRCAETDQDVHGSQDAGMFTWRMERWFLPGPPCRRLGGFVESPATCLPMSAQGGVPPPATYKPRVLDRQTSAVHLQNTQWQNFLA